MREHSINAIALQDAALRENAKQGGGVKFTSRLPVFDEYWFTGSLGKCVLRPKCKVTKDFGGMTPMSNADFGANMADVGAVVWRNGIWLCGDANKQGISRPEMRQWRVRP